MQRVLEYGVLLKGREERMRERQKEQERCRVEGERVRGEGEKGRDLPLLKNSLGEIGSSCSCL